MITTVHTVNQRGSDEYSVHIVSGDEIKVVAIFYKSDKATNRANATRRAYKLVRELGCDNVESHNLSARACAALLPVEAR